MIQIFATDLDGTLLKENHYITQQDKEAIQYLHNKGVEVTIATGRSDNEIKKIYEELDITGHRISQNGTFVYSKENEHIFSQTFSHTLSKKLFNYLYDYDLPCLISNFNDIHYAKDISMVHTLQPLFKTPLIYKPELFDGIEKKHPTSKFMLLGDTAALISLEKEINQSFPDEVSTFLSAQMCLDIVPKGADKSHALTALLKSKQISPTHTASVGDSFNDIHMLSLTQHSYAMKDAPPIIQSHAGKIVSHVHEAVYDLVDKGLV